MRQFLTAVLLMAAGLSLSGCVVAPGPRAYGYYRPAPVVVAPVYRPYYYGPRY